MDLTVPLQDLWTASIGQKTRTTYLTGLQCYKLFLVSSRVIPSTHCHTADLPADEQHLQYFLAHCFKTLKLAFSTVKSYLAGIRYFMLQAGTHCALTNHNSPAFSSIQTLLRGYKKLHHPPSSTRLPITFHVLCKIVGVLRSGLFGHHMDLVLETMCSMAFFGFLRCGEFTCYKEFNSTINVGVGDVFVDKEQERYTFRLKASKTDPFRKGLDIIIFATNKFVCPFRCMLRLIETRQSSGAHHLDPLFIDQRGRPMSRSMFLDCLDIILRRAGYNSNQYSGHSFRIGAATSAAEANIEDHLIQSLGRWRSNCFTRYIHTPETTIQQAQLSMCKPASALST